MTRRTLLISLFCLALSMANAYAGWYECYNFKGSINTNSISLSIQVRDGYFGEKDKKDFNIIGVYKYDNQNSPIRLEGKFNSKDKKVLLYEIINKKYSALFKFEFSENECNGIWTNLSTNKSMPLHLNYVSKLIDTLDENQSSDIEILQANSLPDFYFIGVYSKVAGENKAQMDRLKIIRKKDNLLFQTIDFLKIESKTGNVRTIIYDNVEVTSAKTKQLSIWNDIGRMGGHLNVYFNSKAQKFKLSPNPIEDGTH